MSTLERAFRDKVVWITGASSGIGEALAVALARVGARLVLSARRHEELERVARACAPARSVDVVPLDLGDVDSLVGKAEDVLAKLGSVDVMIHCGGVSQRARVIDTDIGVDERIMRVNYLGTVALTKALLPSMVARRRGHFVVVSSLVGKFGSPLRSSYAASKHALHGFFDSLRAELHDEGIRVTIVCPGFVKTNVSINALTGDGSPQGKMDRATGRGMEPAACAAVILRAAAAEREERYVGGAERFAVYVKRIAPTVFSRFVRRAAVT